LGAALPLSRQTLMYVAGWSAVIAGGSARAGASWTPAGRRCWRWLTCAKMPC